LHELSLFQVIHNLFARASAIPAFYHSLDGCDRLRIVVQAKLAELHALQMQLSTFCDMQGAQII
jgi:hypothetical protein